MNNKICIISGPTASGKTSTSIELAKKFGGEVVNFDSLLFYRELNIGSAKPTKEQQCGIVHHLIDNHSISTPINSADYCKEALPLINKLHQSNKIVYLVGGSGFYLQSLLYGMYDSVTTPKDITTKSELLYKLKGIAPFIEELRVNDPLSHERYHENDHYRIIRAVEHFWTTGQQFSKAREQMKTRKLNGPMYKYQWNLFHIYLDLPKNQHELIIEQRTSQMIQSGLIDEVKHLLAKGFTGDEKPLKSIGYKQVIDYLNGHIPTIGDLGEKIHIATRQLAKAQRTWFKKVEKLTYNPIEDKEKIYNEYKDFLTD